MLVFGGVITLNNLVVYCAYNLEKVLLGRFWGADVLGLYGRAYYLVNIPTESLNTTIGTVAFSALSRVQGDPNLLRQYFMKGYSFVLSMTLPITIGFALFADDVIFIALGPKWEGATEIFRILTPTVLIFGIINPLGWLLISSGFQKRSLQISLVLAPLVIIAYLLGLPYGPKGVAFSYSAILPLWIVPHVFWCTRGTVISPLDILHAISSPFISALVSGLVAYLVQIVAQYKNNVLFNFFLESTVMLLVYTVMMMFVFSNKDMYIDLFRQLKAGT